MPTQTSKSSPTSEAKARKLFWTTVVVQILASLDHAYLLKEHYDLKFGEAEGSTLCNINEKFSCAAVSASRFAELFGVPMAMWGLLANLGLLTLLLWYPFLEDEKRPPARRNLLFVGGVIALASVVMGAISTLLIGTFCPFCMLAYALSFIAFGSLWIWARNVPSRDSTISGSTGFQLADFTPLAVVALIGLVLGFVSHGQVVKSYNAERLPMIIQDAIEGYSIEKPVALDTTNALELGAPADKAKMVITELADFRCIHCKHAAPKLKAFAKAHMDSVRLQFMAWPLDGECNTAISRANGASCLLARIVYCAGASSSAKGWAAHEFVFDSQTRFTNKEAVQMAIPDIAKAAGLDPQALSTCSDSEAAKTAVQKQAAVGTALNIQGTPTIFVNGKRLPNGQILQVLEAVYKTLPEK